MPTYVYRFVETGETIEVQQGFQDDALTEAVHPTTGVAMPVKKVFTPVGVTFKGGGFYKTDSRGGSSRSSVAKSDGDGAAKSDSSKSDTPAATSSESRSESRSESKSESKPESKPAASTSSSTSTD